MLSPLFNPYRSIFQGLIWAAVQFAAVFTLFGHTIQAHAEIYRSVDQEGHTYYSDRPSENAIEIKVRTAPVEEDATTRTKREERRKLLDAYQQDREQKKARLKIEQEKRKERAINCAQTRKKLAEIQRAFFLYEDTADPYNPRIFTAEERQQTEQKLQQQEQQWCD